MTSLWPASRWLLLRCPCASQLSARKSSRISLLRVFLPLPARQRGHFDVAVLRQVPEHLTCKVVHACVDPLVLDFRLFNKPPHSGISVQLDHAKRAAKWHKRDGVQAGDT